MLQAGVLVFMSVFIPSYRIKVGNDKLALVRLFLKHFSNKGWDVAQCTSYVRALRAKKSFPLQKHRSSKNVQMKSAHA